MNYTLSCKTCDVKIGDFDLQDPTTLSTLVLQTHTFGVHSGKHWLSLDPLPSGSSKVELTCKHAGCQYFEKKEIYEVPTYAVSAVVVMFHAKNEGHKFELILNGTELKPIEDIKPDPPSPVPTVSSLPAGYLPPL